MSHTQVLKLTAYTGFKIREWAERKFTVVHWYLRMNPSPAEIFAFWYSTGRMRIKKNIFMTFKLLLKNVTMPVPTHLRVYLMFHTFPKTTDLRITTVTRIIDINFLPLSLPSPSIWKWRLFHFFLLKMSTGSSQKSPENVTFFFSSGEHTEVFLWGENISLLQGSKWYFNIPDSGTWMLEWMSAPSQSWNA